MKSSLFLSLATWAVWCLAQQDSPCSANNPCKLGCCSKSGYCGYGPDFCDSGNCVANCDSKSQCDAGWGPNYSAAEKCPLNVCCSKYGFCGTSADFCGAGNELVPAPSCAGSSSNSRTIGYYEAWSPSRPCDGRYPEDLIVSGYTHINFAFAYIDPVTFKLAPMDADDVPLYSRVAALKAANPGLKVWISVGGWAMNDPGPMVNTFSNLARAPGNQQKFFSALISFMQTYGFDGVDLDWEYPVAPERGGSPADFANYVKFSANLRAALDGTGGKYGFSMTLPASYWYLQNFDIINLEKSVDWFNILAYDLHGTWDANDPYVGNVIGGHTNLTEINSALNLLWRNAIDPSKVVLGLGFYGRSFTLVDPSCAQAGCKFSSGGLPGTCTRTSGVLSGQEIFRIAGAGASVTWDHAAAIKIATYGGNQWVSYDDADTFAQKVKYANANCLGGLMVWAMDLDTKSGDLIAALSKSTGRQNLSSQNLPLGGRGTFSGSNFHEPAIPGLTENSDSISACQWTTCGGSSTTPPSCDSGFSPSFIDTKSCPSSLQRAFCCPNDDKPQCSVKTQLTYCSPTDCGPNDTEIGRVYVGCAYGQGSPICCTRTASDQPISRCKWGTVCGIKGYSAQCPAGTSDPIAWSTTGLFPGSSSRYAPPPCQGDTYRALCCVSPSPYRNCKTFDQDGYSSQFTSTGAFGPGPVMKQAVSKLSLVEPAPGDCNGRCPSDQVLVSSDYAGCKSGQRVTCCDNPAVSSDAVYQALSMRLRTFAQHPFCPADLYAQDSSPDKKRDVRESGSNSSESLSTLLNRRDLGELQISDVHLIAAALNTYGRNYAALQVLDVVNNALGPQLSADNISQWQALTSYSGSDPAQQTLDLMCDFSNAQGDILEYSDEQAAYCVEDPCEHSPNCDPSQRTFGGATGDDPCIAIINGPHVVRAASQQTSPLVNLSNDDKFLDKRIINPGLGLNRVCVNNPPARNPYAGLDHQTQLLPPSQSGINVGRVMRGLRGGDSGMPTPPILYARTFQPDPTNPGDTILEIAWDIRQRPDLNGNDNANIFIVVHFHTSGLCHIQTSSSSADYYPRVPRANIFHGQYVQDIRGDPSNPLWAVQFYPSGGDPNRSNNGATRRQIMINCRQTNTQGNQAAVVWIPTLGAGLQVDVNTGYANQPPFTPPRGASGPELNNFAQFLRDGGFLGTDAYRNWNVLRGQWDPIDPATNQNFMPRGGPGANMAPGTPDNWPTDPGSH